MKKWYQFWLPNTPLPEVEKEKLKNLSPDEINEMLIAEQVRIQEEEANEQAAEAAEFFGRIYPQILHGNFEMDGKLKQFIVKGDIGMPTIQVGRIIQAMFVEKGYRVTNAKPDKWAFGLVRDAADGAKGYFDGVYNNFGTRSGRYWE